MTIPGFILKNAMRNRRRVTLTVGSVAMSLFLLTLLQAMLRGFTDPAATEHAAARIVVRHRVSVANMLFARQQSRIERLPGVAACTRLVWFGGVYRDEANFFPQFACDAPALFEVMTEVRIDPRQREQFLRERTACVVGVKTMERFGWRLGERITLLGAMWPCDPELTVRGVFAGSIDDSMLFFHHEYFDELLGDQGFTGLFWVRADSAAVVPGLIERIDAEFANSDAETKTETERAFQVGFVSMLGNVKTLIGSIAAVIVFALVLVTGGTMSRAVRERGRELAVMKAVGFGRRTLFGLLLAESVGLALAGGLTGCLAAVGLLSVLNPEGLSRGLFVSFAITPAMVARSLALALALGLVTCLPPAWSNLRRRVVDGLGTVD